MLRPQAWEEFFGAHLGPLPAVVSGPCCSEFVTSAAAIRHHPLEFYSAARDWLAGTALGSRQAAKALELAWHLILQQQAEVEVGERECLCALYGTPSVRYFGAHLLAMLAVPPLLAALCTLRTIAVPMLRRRPSSASMQV